MGGGAEPMAAIAVVPCRALDVAQVAAGLAMRRLTTSMGSGGRFGGGRYELFFFSFYFYNVAGCSLGSDSVD
jgi:hypothetical protein